MRSSAARRYGLTLACILLALGIRFLLDPLVGTRIPFATFFVAALFISWYCGSKAGLITLLAGAALGDYFFIEPRGTFSIKENRDGVTIVVYLITGLVTVLFVEMLQRARQKAESKEAEARQAQHVTETLLRISQTLAHQNELREIVQFVTDESTRLTEAGFGAFFYNVRDPNGDAYSLYTLSGVPAEKFSKFPMPRNTALFEPTFRGMGVVRLADVTTDPRYGKNEPNHGMPEGHLPVKSYLAVPVVSRTGEVLGGLFFGHSRANVFTDADEQLVQGIAAQAAVAIENANLLQSVKDADQRKDEFLSLLAHELRNPLAPISNGLQILKMKGEREAADSKAILMMDRQVQHLVRLVDDLLDVSRIVNNKITLRIETTKVGTLVRRAVEISQPIIETDGHRLNVIVSDEDHRLDCDTVRLAQVISNLLNNASRYTPRGGTINLEAGVQGEEVILKVRDNGIGINPAMLSRIWDLFVQAGKEEGQGGLGIGLTLVRSLVKMHGGMVVADSQGHGKGSTFTVRIPLKQTVATSKREPAQNMERSQPGRQVLVVDDNVDAADSLSEMLRLLGHQTMVAHSGEAALALVANRKPDVAFIDLGMPVMNGYQLSERLKGKSELSGLMLVALTGWGQEEDQKRTAAAGFHRHLVKPASVEDIQSVLEMAGEGRR